MSHALHSNSLWDAPTFGWAPDRTNKTPSSKGKIPVIWRQSKKRTMQSRAIHDYRSEIQILKSIVIEGARDVSPAVDSAEAQIRDICASTRVDQAVESRMLATLRASLQFDSVFPSITTDGEDGLIAQWKAGDRFLSVELGSDGSFSFFEVNDAGMVTRNDAGNGRPALDVLRNSLRAFTAYVTDRNPAWRNLYK